MKSKTSEGKEDRTGEFLIGELVKFTNESNYVEKVGSTLHIYILISVITMM
jgi:hypothetical protein